MLKKAIEQKQAKGKNAMEQVNGKHAEQTIKNAAPTLESVANAKITLYIPTMTKSGATIHSASHKTMVDYAARMLASNFGGYTTFKAQGGYVMDNGSLARESVTVVVALARLSGDADSIARVRVVRDLAYILKDILEQDTILLSVEPINAAWLI